MGDRKKVFSEAEVGEIIRRAVELQEKSSAQTYTPGVTQEELERIGREMGVDPEYVRRALESVRGGSPDNLKKLVLAREVERVVDGELDPRDFDLVTSALPPSTDRSPPTQVGRALNAKMMTGMSMTDVTVSARNGRTRVKVRTFPLLNMIFGIQAALFGSIAGAAVLGERGPIALGIAIILAGLGAATGLIATGAKGCEQKAKRIADDVVEKIYEALPEPAAAKATDEDPIRENLAT